LDVRKRCSDGLTAIDIAEKREDVDEDWIRAFADLLESVKGSELEGDIQDFSDDDIDEVLKMRWIIKSAISND